MCKWYSLIDKVYAMDNLRLAFKHVKSNNGAPGIDGQTVKDFQTRLEENLAAIHAELKTNMLARQRLDLQIGRASCRERV